MWILKIIVIFNKKVFNLNKNLLWRKLTIIKNLQKIKNNKFRFYAYLQNKSTTLRIFKNSRTIKLNSQLQLDTSVAFTLHHVIDSNLFSLAAGRLRCTRSVERVLFRAFRRAACGHLCRGHFTVPLTRRVLHRAKFGPKYLAATLRYENVDYEYLEAQTGVQQAENNGVDELDVDPVLIAGYCHQKAKQPRYRWIRKWFALKKVRWLFFKILSYLSWESWSGWV